MSEDRVVEVRLRDNEEDKILERLEHATVIGVVRPAGIEAADALARRGLVKTWWHERTLMVRRPDRARPRHPLGGDAA